MSYKTLTHETLMACGIATNLQIRTGHSGGSLIIIGQLINRSMVPSEIRASLQRSRCVHVFVCGFGIRRA